MESRTFQLLEFPKVLRVLADHAVSTAGENACLALVPLGDEMSVRLQNRLLEQAMSWRAETGFRLNPFEPLDGLAAILERPTAILDQDDLFALLKTLEQAKSAREALQSCGERDWEELLDAVVRAPWPATVWSAVRRCLDDEGRLRDESSPGLMAVRGEIRSIHQRCTKRVKDFILGEDLSRFLQDEFMTISSDRYVLPLKANFKGRFPGIIHDYSQTGETCYFEPMFLVEMNNQLQELKQEERREERKVLEFLTDIVRQERDAVIGCYRALVRLDVLLAKVGLGLALGGRTLDIEPDLPPRLLEARHPLLALDKDRAVPLDIKLQPGQHALVISGGNAGGKTVCLKTLGLIALMGLSGLPVPVGLGSSIPVWRDIFVVLGDEQSLEDHVSTFTAQVRYLSRVWERVAGDTLFLLDEFGAGTDPTQGAALAQAVLDSLLERRATVMVATHFPALKAHALAAEGVRAASVLFDPTTKRPLFRLAYDQVGASIALEVAREHGLPGAILDRAAQYLLLDGSDTTAVLDRLNTQAVARDKELKALEEERERLRRKRVSLEAEFARERSALMDEIKAQAQAVLHEWKSGKLGRKQALKKFAEARERLVEPGVLAAEATPPAFGWDDLRPGLPVCYLPWDRQGTVQEKDERKRQIKVDLDGLSLWVKEADLGPAAQTGISQGVPAAAPSASGPTQILDLRGQRADEALRLLERFLDDALLRGTGSVEIIHGRGTGALRREVHEFLRQSPAVNAFALAPEDRGGDGMTEATLK
ncbi:Smr/MutS family protein [Desulfovibrio aminophilus]|uniref:endonuclease MutS2 n=1 Tax=Desulfovibrio aminophilus TaxID=81425 RepID=UPI003395A5B4